MTKEKANENLKRTYELKNRGLEIKLNVMEILYKRFNEMDVLMEKQDSLERRQTLLLMAEIGKAILPD